MEEEEWKEKAGNHSWRREVGSPHRPQGHLSSDAQRGEAGGSIKQISDRAGRRSGGGMDHRALHFLSPVRSHIFLHGALFCDELRPEGE